MDGWKEEDPSMTDGLTNSCVSPFSTTTTDDGGRTLYTTFYRWYRESMNGWINESIAMKEGMDEEERRKRRGRSRRK